ncbi:MAG: type II toxin-antitoxin system RelE/ParE family toxin [Phenylobacterium sp.]|uniref:type II toxin-antitoxin system RelE/ParE family toxin n=1 Tax=Phenylobacterium sp. TaxID=1871053 RepID=UPI002734613A|nr:type II toxin-antitoxin system RelE/ParE family toxin [Phenylobacterium sp.]MDP3745901.1 type II toxin-antitoxin system RelE/ParE family toxin [Phenylobacterium sp.]
MALKVDRAPQATLDEREIFLTIAADNPSAAERFLIAIYDAEDRLAEFPQLGRPRADFGSTIRSWTVEPYLIFYSVELDAVVILRILHGARDLGDLIPDG